MAARAVPAPFRSFRFAGFKRSRRCGTLAFAMHAYLEFEVALRYLTPRIWRRFQIAVNATFLDLHRAIQDSFGWEHAHLWQFQTPGRDAEVIAGIPSDSPFASDWEDTPDAGRIRLTRYFDTAQQCVYWYDFGDDWLHTVKLRERLSSEDRFTRRLLAGRRACPPEDCGGAHGYGRIVEFLRTGTDPWRDGDAELAAWVGDWKPDDFSLAVAKSRFDR